MRSRRSRQSLKVSHTQTSVPCGTINYTTSRVIVKFLETSLIQKITKPLLNIHQNTKISLTRGSLAKKKDNVFAMQKQSVPKMI